MQSPRLLSSSQPMAPCSPSYSSLMRWIMNIPALFRSRVILSNAPISLVRHLFLTSSFTIGSSNSIPISAQVPVLTNKNSSSSAGMARTAAAVSWDGTQITGTSYDMPRISFTLE